MKIRKAKLEDVKNIAKLAREYDKYENKLDKKHSIDSIKDNEEFSKKVISNKLGIIFVLEINNKIEGIISGEYGINLMGKRGMIHYFFISEKERGKGYGKIMIKEIEKYFKKKGCNAVQSFVFKGNKKVLKFYNKLKFSSDEEGFTIRKKLK